MISRDKKIFYEAKEKIDALFRAKIPEKMEVSRYSDEIEKQFAESINQLTDFFSEISEFIIPLSQGQLNTKIPRTKNFLASPFKELHSRLMHLTWQAQQIAKGDYSQRVDFMGDFSAAFNSMVVSLAQKEKELKQKIVQLEDTNKQVQQEVKERKQKEEALRKSERFLNDVFESIQDGISVLNTDLTIRLVNGVMRQWYAENLPLEGKKCHVCYHNRNEPCDPCPTLRCFQSGQTEREIVPGLSGSPVEWIELFSYPIIDQSSGEVTGVVEFVRDITHTKKIEARLQHTHKMEALGTLTGGIAHEFNNVLGIIIGNTELALDDVPEWNPAHFNLDEIKTASLRAKDVVRQLLSYIRKIDYKRKPMKIIPVIKDSIKFLRASMPSTIEIRYNIEATADTILADSTQIHQTMINLGTNASHAMEETGGILGIEIQNVALDEDIPSIDLNLNPGSYVKVTVSDTGQGIDPEIIDRIFDPFFTTKEVGKGAGLGLSVVHGVVKGYGGAITVYSELGKGTSFTTYFPIVEEEAAIESKPVEEQPTGNESILFVDDEKSIMRMGNQRLERLGYQVESTTSPLEALDLFRSKPDRFDLVITDLTMPKMTGDKLVKEILNIRPDMPIIICTGFSEKMDGDKARAIGASGYLEKPHEKRDLAKTVRKVLDGK
ncbi:MAG: response regulator [Desulfobacteraceae bacterium]|nr:response regulator [Desulfobacteraceae bacterium]